MRKKKQLKKFADWFCSMCNLPRIKISFINARSLRAPSGEFCFGCYEYNRNLHSPGSIYMAYDLPKDACLAILCHELVHLYQHMHNGLDSRTIYDIEAETEKNVDTILSMWRACVAAKRDKSLKRPPSFTNIESIPKRHVTQTAHPALPSNHPLAPIKEPLPLSTMEQCRCPQCLHSVRVLRDSNFRFTHCPVCGVSL